MVFSTTSTYIELYPTTKLDELDIFVDVILDLPEAFLPLMISSSISVPISITLGKDKLLNLSINQKVLHRRKLYILKKNLK